MTTNAHTPTPWEVGDLDHNGQRIVRGEHIEICTCWHHCVGSIEREMEANAAFIVRAVNAHEELVAALRETRDQFEVEYRGDRISCVGHASDGLRKVVGILDAALAKLEASS